MDFSNITLSKSDEKIYPNKENLDNIFKKTRCFTQDLNSNKETPAISTKDQVSSVKSHHNHHNIPAKGSYMTESLLGTPKADFIIENVAFKGEKDYQDKDICAVCEIEFSSKFGLKVFKKKFCCICGKSVCRICSKRKINGKRVCDICLLRTRAKNAEIRKKEILYEDQRKINVLKEKIEENLKLRDLYINEHILLDEKLKKDEKDREKAIEGFENSIETKKNMEKDYISKIKLINEEYLLKKQDLKKIKQKYDNFKNEHISVKKSLEEKKAEFISKLQEYARLKKHREDMEKSESFVSMLKSKSLISPEIINKTQISPLNDMINSNNNENSSKKDISVRSTSPNKNNEIIDKKINNNSVSYQERSTSLLENKGRKKSSVNKSLITDKKCYPCNYN